MRNVQEEKLENEQEQAERTSIQTLKIKNLKVKYRLIISSLIYVQPTSKEKD